MHPIAAEILAANDREVKKVPTPEWGRDDIYARSLTTTEAFALEVSIHDLVDVPSIMIAQFVAFACDEAGNAIFSAEEAKPLADKRMIVLRRVNDAGMALNGMGSLEAEKQKS